MKRLSRALFATAAIFFCSGHAAFATSNYSVGVEGFRDVYNEPAATVDEHSNYGSVTAGYMWTSRNYFTAIDARYSKGTSDYKSDSGTDNGTPQTETDTRLRFGTILPGNGNTLEPYIGLGWRWFFDNGKGRFAYINGSPNAFAYDRRINQLYLPIGITDHFASGSWMFSWTAEIDPLLYGIVKSRLAEGGDPAERNAVNHQTSGVGGRGEFMVGRKMGQCTVEAGPFIRYWNIRDSDIQEGGLEPQNNRMQYGVAMKILY